MIALFFGSRGWTDRDTIRDDLADLPAGTVVVEGGASGADRIAREEAHKLGIHVATVNAIWSRGNSAGPRRNAAMLALRPDVAYGYTLGTPGSRDMARRCIEGRVPLHVRQSRGDQA